MWRYNTDTLWNKAASANVSSAHHLEMRVHSVSMAAAKLQVQPGLSYFSCLRLSIGSLVFKPGCDTNKATCVLGSVSPPLTPDVSLSLSSSMLRLPVVSRSLLPASLTRGGAAAASHGAGMEPLLHVCSASVPAVCLTERPLCVLPVPCGTDGLQRGLQICLPPRFGARPFLVRSCQWK